MRHWKHNHQHNIVSTQIPIQIVSTKTMSTKFRYELSLNEIRSGQIRVHLWNNFHGHYLSRRSLDKLRNCTARNRKQHCTPKTRPNICQSGGLCLIPPPATFCISLKREQEEANLHLKFHSCRMWNKVWPGLFKRVPPIR